MPELPQRIPPGWQEAPDVFVKDFLYSEGAEPHCGRTRAILKAHPELRELFGQKNPYTFLIIVAAVGAQVALAWSLREAGTGTLLLVAYLVGAFLSHTLFVCIHEAAHHLIFRQPRWNLIAGVVANLPTLVPTALSFRHFHLKHHTFQGVHDLDADLPSHWEARLIGCGAPGKATWLLFFPLFQTLRTLRTREVKAFDGWTLLNIAVQGAFAWGVYHLMGTQAILYLLASFWFSVGLHPLGARWIQEHYLVLDDQQETYSYYGPLNFINLNVGYHNEHHDFPSVPWHLLPEVKKRAPEFYDTLLYHDSFLKLFFQFLFEQEITLFRRIVRPRPRDARRRLGPGLHLPELEE